jgi:hypothetical protein
MPAKFMWHVFKNDVVGTVQCVDVLRSSIKAAWSTRVAHVGKLSGGVSGTVLWPRGTQTRRQKIRATSTAWER